MSDNKCVCCKVNPGFNLSFRSSLTCHDCNSRPQPIFGIEDGKTHAFPYGHEVTANIPNFGQCFYAHVLTGTGLRVYENPLWDEEAWEASNVVANSFMHSPETREKLLKILRQFRDEELGGNNPEDLEQEKNWFKLNVLGPRDDTVTMNPSAPLNFRVVEKTHNSVTFEWEPAPEVSKYFETRFYYLDVKRKDEHCWARRLQKGTKCTIDHITGPFYARILAANYRGTSLPTCLDYLIELEGISLEEPKK